MALEKSYSKDFESDELFDYEIIKPKKTLKIRYTYAKRYYKEVEKFAKNLTTYYGKRYRHTKMASRRVKMSSIIANKKLKYIYLTWLKAKGIKWNDIDKALKDLII